MKPLVLVAAILPLLWSPALLAQANETDVPVRTPSPALSTELDDPVVFHFAGYADATFISARGRDSEGAITLAPIFHLQAGDRFFVETEFESEATDSGERKTAIEYANINWLINDNLALIAGKFLSPAGNFFQNLHPSWINKAASAPVGFGHGGAAPLSDVGLQLRGGKAFSSGQQLNYSLYYANGPRLRLEGMGALADGGEVEEFEFDLDAEGSPDNPDGERVTGGRIGWMPVPQLELGASAVRGKVVLDAAGMEGGMAEPSRDYRVSGLDAAWSPRPGVELRAEWIRQELGAAAMSLVPQRAVWRAWYAQGACRFGGDKWEAVARYGDSVSPHSEATVQQTAIGLNYLIRPYSQVKLNWEFNDSPDEVSNADRLLLQIAYGF